MQDSDNDSMEGTKKKEEETPGGPTPGFFGNIGTLLGLTNSETPGEPFKWKEFPWERYMVKEDIINKWKKVDVGEINNLLRNFDAETKEFVNVELELVSQIYGLSERPSQVTSKN